MLFWLALELHALALKGARSGRPLFKSCDNYVNRSCGPMDKASVYGTGDCRFESYQDQLFLHCRLRRIRFSWVWVAAAVWSPPRGSIPGSAHGANLLFVVQHKCLALLAQWLERAAVNRKVTGSIPVGSVLLLSFLRVSVEKLRDRELNPGHPRDRRIY